MFKKAVQRGRSEREAEAYPFHPPSPSLLRQAIVPRLYVEALSDAKTKHGKGAYWRDREGG
jgi:hypothetical protein